MKKINYNGSIAEDARLLKRKSWFSLVSGMCCAAVSLCLLSVPRALVEGPVVLGQIFYFVVGGICIFDFGYVVSHKKAAKKRLNNLVGVVSDKEDFDLIDDIKVIEADLTVENVKEYCEVPGDYILIKKNDGTSSIIREFMATDVNDNLKEEYKHYLMDLRNSLEVDKIVSELDNVGEFPIISNVPKKELK